MRLSAWSRGMALAMAAVLTAGAAMAQEGKISDEERAKRDAAKVFNFIKFQTVRKDRDEKKDEKKEEKKTVVAHAAPKTDAAPAKAAEAQPVSRSLAPATTPLAEVKTAAAPVVATTLPPAAPPPGESAAPVPTAATPAPTPAPEPEPDDADEVPLKLLNYVAPEMNRQVLDAMGGRDHAVPVRFTVEPNGVVSQADPRPGAQRKLGLAAARAIQQWRFAPLPERRVVDVELMFRASAD